MIKKIATYPHQVLRQVSTPVEEFNTLGLQALIQNLLDTEAEHKAFGLAAVQIFCPVQVLVAYGQTFINPRILSSEGDPVSGQEACLSIPGRNFMVKRFPTIELAYQDVSGTAWKLKAEGFFARVLQHEIDHLKGVLILD